MKKSFILSVAILFSLSVFSQARYFTKSGKISFYSKAPMEDIEAHNNNAISVVDKSTGELEFSVLMKGFQFEKALMQEHFNENYVESDKYPKAVFKGQIAGPAKIDFSKDGKYTTNISGKLTIHGQTKEVSAPGTFIVENGHISASTEFTVSLDDYNISIPSIMKEKISKTVKVVVQTRYEAMN